MKKCFDLFKKLNTVVPLIIIGIFLTSCTDVNRNNSSTSEQVNPIEPVSIENDSINREFTLLDETGKKVPLVDGNYLIASSGKYAASGKLLERQIIVDASYKEVVLDLEGVSITNSSYSPIFVRSVSKIKINVSRGTTNYVYDNRMFSYSRKDIEQGLGAINIVDGNVELTGKGTLEVISLNNSGIYSRGHVAIKTETIFINAFKNGVVSDDSIDIDNNPYLEIRSGQDGLKTSYYYVDIDAHKYGDVNIHSGKILISSNEDAVDATHSIVVGDSNSETTIPYITCYTGKYSKYYNSFITSINIPSSSKGIKAKEEITFNNGDVYLRTYDDGIHSDSKQIVESSYSISPKANISIFGGNIVLYSLDDAIHADGEFVITGGSVDVLASHEGIEADSIFVNGGYIRITPVDYLCDEYAQAVIQTDDAINAHQSISINGGVIDASSNPDKEVDCIDSNGTFAMTGGIVIVRGPNGNDCGAIECTGSITVNGGSLLCSGSMISSIGSISIPLGRKHVPLSGIGEHAFMIEEKYSYTNVFSYNETFVYSNESFIVIN